MFAKKPLAGAISAVTAAGAFTAGMAVPLAAHAQEETIEEIVVTGSRITQAGLTSVSPVTQVDSEEFTFRGITAVEDILNELPQVAPTNTQNDANGASGTATIDLRNLGSVRTLVLQNGRRLPGGSPNGTAATLSPDLNQIPSALIERVEVLTGGASASYGSDAIAGVVNFILRDDFEGVKVDYRYSANQHRNNNNFSQNLLDARGFGEPDKTVWDGDLHDLSLVFGTNLGDGRGNVTGYLQYRDQDEVVQGDRDFSRCAINGADTSCGGSTTLPQGRVTDFGLQAPSFDFVIAGTDFVDRQGEVYNYAPTNHLIRPSQRFNAGFMGHYEIADGHEAYGEFGFMDHQTDAQIAPSGAFFVTGTLNCANPLLSAQQQQRLCLDRGFSATDTVTAYVGRRNVEGAPRSDDLQHTSFRGVVGFRGDLGENWSYDVFYNRGEVNYQETYQNDLSTTRLLRALNAVDDGNGNAVCQSVVDGSDPNCVPYNVFQTGGVTAAQTQYLSLPLFARGELLSKQAVGYLAGDTGFTIPSATDSVQAVFGLEYRSDKMEFNPDQGFQSGDGAGQGGPTPAVSGSISVTEFFTEFEVPLVQDRSGVQNLSFTGQYRFSDYKGGANTDTFKVGLTYAPTDDISIRGAFQRAIRTANVRELFRPQNLGLFSMNEDPCAGATPTATLAQCMNTGVTAAQYGTIADNPAQQYNQITGGNPDLEPEEADTFTVGLVITPRAVDGLSITVDYFDIEVEGAIQGLDPETIHNECLATGDPVFCNQVNRGSTGTLWIQGSAVSSTDINIGAFETSGVDLGIAYTTGLGDMGSLQVGFTGTYLDEFNEIQRPGDAPIKCAGTWGGSCSTLYPEWRHMVRASWSTPWLDGALLSANWRYIGEMDGFDSNLVDLDSKNYFDLTGQVTVIGGIDLTVGVNNIFDVTPQVSGSLNTSTFGNGNIVPGLYDALGRFIHIGVSKTF